MSADWLSQWEAQSAIQIKGCDHPDDANPAHGFQAAVPGHRRLDAVYSGTDGSFSACVTLHDAVSARTPAGGADAQHLLSKQGRQGWR